LDEELDDQQNVDVTPFTIGGNSISNPFDLELNDRQNEPFYLSGSNVVYDDHDA